MLTRAYMDPTAVALRQIVGPRVIVDVLYVVVVIAYQPWGTLEQRFL